jgi:ComF family protein
MFPLHPVLARVRDALASLVYPLTCAACDAPSEALFCPACAPAAEPLGPACPACALPLPRRAACLACLRRPPPFCATRSVYLFGGAVAQALRRLKWTARPDLGPRLAATLDAHIAGEVELIAPVPLGRRRLRTRGYNQAALLALGTAARARVDVHALRRARDTAPQSGLDPAAREANVRGAFIADARRVAGRRVLVIDDVMTTGATARAAARALLAAGAAEVRVLTVARAVT